MQKITTNLWFDNNAEEAVKFYLSVFKKGNGKIVSELRWPKGTPGEGQVLTLTFTLFGQEYIALNGGPHFKFNEAVSLVVDCDTQAEVDEYWNKLTTNGGEESQCGWLKDKFGLSWQIVPGKMLELFKDKDQQKATRAINAMMQMRKLDLQKVQDAFDGK